MDIQGQVKKLYSKKLSGSEISTKLNIHLRQVYRILDKLEVSRRSPAQQNKIRFLRSPLSYTFKENCTGKNRDLLIAGLMLYYGEGAKGNSSVDFANSDVRMHKIFIRFLRVICGVNEKRLRFYLYCFSDQDPHELINFWSKELRADKNSFTKPYIRKVHENLNRRTPYGVLHIRYSDSRLLERILSLNLKIAEKMLE